MIDIAKLKRSLAKVKDEMRSICKKALETDDRRMSDSQGKRYCDLENQVKLMEDQIKTAERSNSLEMDSSENYDSSETNNHNENKFDSLGEMLLAVREAARPGGTVDNRLVCDEKRAPTGMGESIPSDGDYLVQQDLLKGLQRKIFANSIIASKCQKLIIGARFNGIKWYELDEASRADGYRHGGVQVYWAAEGGTVTPTRPKLKKKQLDLEKLMAFVYVTDELKQDAVGLESVVTPIIVDEFSFMVDEAVIEGNGAGVPLGIENSDCVISVAKESGQAAGTIVYENVVKMRSRLWSRSRAKSNWFINQDCEPELQTMALVVGTGGVPVYMPAAGLSDQPYDTLFARPVIPIEHCKTVGTFGDIILADFNQYRLIDKGGLKQASSIHVRFLYDEDTFRFIYRTNGMPLWSSPLTPKNGTNTVSPFVSLATRS